MRLIRIFAFSALFIPASLQAQEAQGYAPASEATTDIIETAKAAGSFNTLAKAIEAAGLTETLKGEGPFTVFAPTDEAFAKLPKGTVESLLQDKEKLATILKYHVIAGEVSSSQAMKISEANTVAEKPLKISKSGKKLMVGKATVTQADIAGQQRRHSRHRRGVAPMKLRLLTLGFAAVAFATGCSDDDDNGTGPTTEAAMRVVHASPDAPNVDVLVDDAQVLSAVPYLGSSSYLPVPAGSRNVKVNAAGTSTTVIDADVDLTTGISYTVIAGGLVSEIEPLVLEDDLTAPTAGNVKVRAVHGAPSAPAVDVYVTAPGADLAVGDSGPDQRSVRRGVRLPRRFQRATTRFG